MFNKECAKFRGSRAVVGLVGLVPSCHCAFVGVSWVQDFSRGYFVGLKFFLVVISWVQSFFLVVISWVQNFLLGIRGSEIFSREYFVGQSFFLVSNSWAQFFP